MALIPGAGYVQIEEGKNGLVPGAGYISSQTTDSVVNLPLSTLSLTGIAPVISTTSNSEVILPASSLSLTSFAPEIINSPASHHRYWRVYVTANNGAANLTIIAELEFLDGIGGIDQAEGGTPAASSVNGPTYEADKGFDGGVDLWGTASGSATPSWISYDFGTPVAVPSFTMQAYATFYAEEMPKDFELQYSDDNATWTTALTIVGESSWGEYEVREFSSDTVLDNIVSLSAPSLALTSLNPGVSTDGNFYAVVPTASLSLATEIVLVEDGESLVEPSIRALNSIHGLQEVYAPSVGSVDGVYDLPAYEEGRSFLDNTNGLATYVPGGRHVDGGYLLQAFIGGERNLDSASRLKVFQASEGVVTDGYTLGAYQALESLVTQVNELATFTSREATVEGWHSLSTWQDLSRGLDDSYALTTYLHRDGLIESRYALQARQLLESSLSAHYGVGVYQAISSWLDGNYALPKYTDIGIELRSSYHLEAYWAILGRVEASYNLGALEAVAAFVDAYYALNSTEVFYGLATNLNSGATSRYEGFNFNSLSGNRGANETGIYELSGEDDAGVAIEGSVDLGILNFEDSLLRRIVDAYLGVNSNGELVLTTSTESGTMSYTLTGSGRLETIKANLARGHKGRYWNIRVANVAGSSMELDSVELNELILSRRI